MNRPLIALALILGASVSAVALPDEGFKPLFNGKDLTGWVLPKDKTLWTVEDGVILGKCDGKTEKNEFLVTDKPYADFILKAKVKYTSGNSGIQFRSEREPNGKVNGPQADVAKGYWGLFYEENRRGILERYPEKEANALVKNGDWNDFEIMAKGDHVTIAINGVKVIDRTDPKFDKTRDHRSSGPQRTGHRGSLQGSRDQGSRLIHGHLRGSSQSRTALAPSSTGPKLL